MDKIARELLGIAKMLTSELWWEEDAQRIYQNSLDDDYWSEATEKYPNYNRDEKETIPAVKYILKGMTDKYGEDYSDTDWMFISCGLQSKIHAGLT